MEIVKDYDGNIFSTSDLFSFEDMVESLPSSHRQLANATTNLRKWYGEKFLKDMANVNKFGVNELFTKADYMGVCYDTFGNVIELTDEPPKEAIYLNELDTNQMERLITNNFALQIALNESAFTNEDENICNELAILDCTLAYDTNTETLKKIVINEDLDGGYYEGDDFVSVDSLKELRSVLLKRDDTTYNDDVIQAIEHYINLYDLYFMACNSYESELSVNNSNALHEYVELTKTLRTLITNAKEPLETAITDYYKTRYTEIQQMGVTLDTLTELGETHQNWFVTDELFDIYSYDPTNRIVNTIYNYE